MMEPEPGPHATPTQAEEWGAALALLPIAATLDFYALPVSLQEQTLVQFAPQIVAYLSLRLLGRAQPRHRISAWAGDMERPELAYVGDS